MPRRDYGGRCPAFLEMNNAYLSQHCHNYALGLGMIPDPVRGRTMAMMGDLSTNFVQVGLPLYALRTALDTQRVRV